MVETEHSDKKTAMKISAVSIIVNLVLSAFKMLAGIIAGSGAMISDAVHSASDVFSTIIVMAGVNISCKASDKEHQYGHERMESVASVVLSVILLATGLGIGYEGFLKIFGGNYGNLEIPGVLALIAAVVSIIVKEWMYWYTRAGAKRIHSDALMADAWHHRSDSLSSIGAFIGILGARLGFPILDPAASVLICIFIVKAAADIFRDAINKMVDKSCDKETESAIAKTVLAQDGVMGIDLLQTRMFGPKLYVDIEISADGSKTLNETHQIAEVAHNAIECEFPNVKHCMIHVNPFKE